MTSEGRAQSKSRRAASRATPLKVLEERVLNLESAVGALARVLLREREAPPAAPAEDPSGAWGLVQLTLAVTLPGVRGVPQRVQVCRGILGCEDEDEPALRTLVEREAAEAVTELVEAVRTARGVIAPAWARGEDTP